jgi:NAD kinase
MHDFDKVVVVTRKTALDELVRRFNTRDQARFYIEHMGGSFAEYQDAHTCYRDAVRSLRGDLPTTVRAQWIDREFLPTFTFGSRDLVVTLGPDGLVVNTAKYLAGQPLLAFNPDPSRIDGVLVPFPVAEARHVLRDLLEGQFGLRRVTMARVRLNDGQTLDAVNDLFIGRKTHVSARYRLRHGDREEGQSSSGIIVSTGAGSTGWLRSVLAGAAGVVEALEPGKHVQAVRDSDRFDWEEERLVFAVREPFVSKVSAASLVYGRIEARRTLQIVSEMPQDGVIFSDGVEEDHLAFNSGSIATIGVADRKLHLVVPGPATPPRRGKSASKAAKGAGDWAAWGR